MASGIYIYTFASGAQYVGQAIDIEDRWEQHKKKMYSGKHTKLVQAEFDKYGFPEFDVLVYCHPHYLDAMESLYIYNIKPTLNTAIPKTYLTRSIDLLVRQDTLDTNAYEILSRYDRLEEELEEKNFEIMRVEDRLREVAIEKLPEESKQILREAEKRASEMISHTMRERLKLTELQNKVNQYNNKSWWYRLWHKV